MRFQKPVVVLINRRCFSATNDFVNAMIYCPNVILLGDKTGGGSGLPFNSELPNGWSVRFSASPTFNAQMQQIEFGIEPDVYVSLSAEDVQKGKDSLVEAARQLIKTKAIQSK
jgi:C-terminal processing protease CtpA/Prc